MITLVAPRKSDHAALAELVSGLSPHAVGVFVSVVEARNGRVRVGCADIVVTLSLEDAEAACGHTRLRPYGTSQGRTDAAVVTAPRAPDLARAGADVDTLLLRDALWRAMRRRGYLARMRPRDLPIGSVRKGSLLPVCDLRASLVGTVPLDGPALAGWQWLAFLAQREPTRDDCLAAAAWSEVDRQARIIERTTGRPVSTVALSEPDLLRQAKARARALDLRASVPPVAKDPGASAWARSTVEALSPIVLTR